MVTTAPAVPFLDMAGINAPLRDEHQRVWESVLGHGRYVGGPEVEIFEGEFAAYCGTTRCVGVGNGTDALELILAALGIGRGDEVIVQANTFVASAEAVCAVGATPVFVDVLPDTLQIDPAAVAAAVTPRTAAVMAVHLFGHMPDLDALAAVTDRHGLALIEDAAQAHGARSRDRRAGGVGVAAGFSFYPGKNLGALGDGGAVTTSDDALADRVRRLADHGRTAADRHVNDLRGRNSRLDTLQAGVLSAKLRTLDQANDSRRAAMAQYRRELPPTCEPVVEHPVSEAVHHLAIVQVDDRAKVTTALTDHNVGWAIHYPVPCHLQPAYAKVPSGPELPHAERAATRIVSLPMSPTITEAQVSRVCEVLHEVVGSPEIGGPS